MPGTHADWHYANYVLNNNLEDKFESLRGIPGICLDPLPWKEIKAHICGSTEESLGTMGRHPRGLVEYRQFRAQVLPCPSSSLTMPAVLDFNVLIMMFGAPMSKYEA